MAASTRFLLAAILLLLVGPPKTTEGRRRIHVIDIPKLTTEGARPGEAKPSDYFFLDETAGDLVLDYPSDLSEESFGAPSSEKRIRERVRLAIGVKPTIETSVTINGDFTYQYRLGNELQANQGIGKWVLGLPRLGDDFYALVHPAGWGSGTRELPDKGLEDRLSVMNLIPNTRPLTRDDLVMKRASWWYRGLGGDTLPPGVCCLSFVVRSGSLPGILTAYFQGTPYKVWTNATVPRALSDLVPAFNFIETNSVAMPVIGPKFEPTTLVETRVCDIVGDVKALVSERRMNATPFSEGLLALARDCLDRTPAGLALAVEGLAGRAEEPFEKEILHALQMNLAVP